ncbi:MAG: MFS transporter [Sulfurospirillum sp.]|nr:MFS transporter [Sulfurospirillum sp.]
MIKSIWPLSFIVALRFLGLFIVLPVLSIYALALEGSNPLLVGIAIGGYAATQMFLQLPFGLISDKIGRKVTLTIGLLIFAAGSLVCAYASDIYMLIFGRLLQGAGAIGAVATAMISDMVKEEVRAKAMAFMGASIALSFAVAMVLGPTIGAYWGIDKLFFITASFALLAIVILHVKVENPPKITHNYETDKKEVLKILFDVNLLKMNITNMLQKGMMTLSFLIVPIIMTQDFAFAKKELWMVYVPAMVFGIFAMGFSAVMGEKKKKPKLVLIIGIVLFALAFLLMAIATNALVFIAGVIVFFIGFNIHEPLLQSLASKYAKIHQKGAALGVFNTFGYFGTFTGSLWGGHALKWYGLEAIAIVVLITCVLWVLLIISLENPIFTKNLYLPFGSFEEMKLEVLNLQKGVIEWYKNENEQILIVKYNSKEITQESITAMLGR